MIQADSGMPTVEREGRIDIQNSEITESKPSRTKITGGLVQYAGEPTMGKLTKQTT